jgi:hypothetical protein
VRYRESMRAEPCHNGTDPASKERGMVWKPSLLSV